MFKQILAATAVVLSFSAAAEAADITIETFSDNSTYIKYSGETKVSDVQRLEAAYEEATKATKTSKDAFGATVVHSDSNFSGVIVLDGPGGHAQTGIRLAVFIAENNLTTVAAGPCYSACSLMWLAGEEDRYIAGDAEVGFHFAYHTNVKEWEKQKALVGWLGIQDQIAQNTHYYTAWLLRFGIKDPARFVYQMALNGSASSFYIINKSNVNEYVGGKVY